MRRTSSASSSCCSFLASSPVMRWWPCSATSGFRRICHPRQAPFHAVRPRQEPNLALDNLFRARDLVACRRVFLVVRAVPDFSLVSKKRKRLHLTKESRRTLSGMSLLRIRAVFVFSFRRSVVPGARGLGRVGPFGRSLRVPGRVLAVLVRRLFRVVVRRARLVFTFCSVHSAFAAALRVISRRETDAAFFIRLARVRFLNRGSFFRPVLTHRSVLL